MEINEKNNEDTVSQSTKTDNETNDDDEVVSIDMSSVARFKTHDQKTFRVNIYSSASVMALLIFY